MDDVISRNTRYPKPYWPNTSSNSIVRELVERADSVVRGEIEELINISNEEIRYIYRNTIQEWFVGKQKGYDPAPLYEGIRMGECRKIEDFINGQLSGSISYYDGALRQIRERNYASGLFDEGCCEVLEYGFCFCRKNCMVKVVKRDAA